MSSEVRWTIGVGTALGIGLAGLIMTQNASMRAEMRENHIALQSEISSLRTDIDGVNADIDGINAQLYTLNTRISRIEGGLFGMEIPSTQDQHQDPSVEE